MMTNFLVKTFIKNPEDINNPQVREKYGTLSSIVGIICNIMLFVLKYIMGTLAHSISVISDAFNNLSDCASCIVTLLGYKMAAKPADKEHPFGHGRIEYLVSLVIAAIIMLMGFELLKDSFFKLFKPQKIESDYVIIISLIISICLKLWMSVFNTKLGKSVNSSAMLATAKDSKSDVIATSATIIAIICSSFTSLPVDSIMGFIISLLILKSGIDIIRDTVDELLGKPVDPDLVKELFRIIKADERIIGVHDLVIHNYGPSNLIGSCHLEFRTSENFVLVHDLVDRIEKEIYDKLRVAMTIHMDPIEIDDERVNAKREMIGNILKEINPELSFHDFRMVSGDTHTNLIFDIVVPFDFALSNEQIKEKIDKAVNFEAENCFTVITFDRSFT